MSMTLTGGWALRRVLKMLPDRIYRKVVRQMTGKMATPVVKAARRNLEAVQSDKARGVLAKAITKRNKTYIADGAVVTVVGARWKGVERKGEGTKPTSEVISGPHAHLVEFGHRMVVGGTVRRLKKQWSASRSKRTGKRGGGRVVGFVKAKPFMRPAFDATKGQAMAIAERALRVGVEREAKKLVKGLLKL